MKRTTAIAIFTVFIYYALSIAASGAWAYTLFLHRGSELTGTLTGSLDSRESRAGDPVVFDVHGVGVPEGSLLRGRIEEVSPFSPGHAAVMSVLLHTLDVPGETPVRVVTHVLGVSAGRKSAFSRIREGFRLVAASKGDLLLKKGALVRVQTLEDIRISDEAPARMRYSHTRPQEVHDPQPTQGAHPYDAGGEMPY